LIADVKYILLHAPIGAAMSQWLQLLVATAVPPYKEFLYPIRAFCQLIIGFILHAATSQFLVLLLLFLLIKNYI